MRWIASFEDLGRDLCLAARALRRTPGVSAAAVVTLMLGIAATTVVVGAVRAFLFPVVPVEAPDRLVALNERLRNGNVSTDAAQYLYSYGHYLAYREHARDVFAGVAPAGFHGTMVGIVADVWVPVEAYRRLAPRVAQDSAPAAIPKLTIFGRLRPDVGVLGAVGLLLAARGARDAARRDADGVGGPGRRCGRPNRPVTCT